MGPNCKSSQIGARAVLGIILVSVIPGAAFSQDRWVVSPNRGGAEGAKANAQIHTLINENSDRKNENIQTSAQLSAVESRLSVAEAELNQIQDHAKTALSACSESGKKLQWNGSSWVCADEVDPTVGAHAKSDRTPPYCHETNAKLIWSTDSGGSWKCVTDQQGANGITSESDPKVGVLMTGKWCRSNGSQVVCASDLPAETDPKIGPINDGKWCYSSAGKIVCDREAPAAPTAQLGTPLYARTISYNDWNTYNAHWDEMVALHTPWVLSNGTYSDWATSCKINNGYINGNPDVHRQEYCGRWMCAKATGKWPFMVQIGDRCNQSGDLTCNDGNFFYSWRCMTE